MLGELASIVPPSSLPVTSSLTSDTGLDREDSNGSSCKDENSEPSSSIDRLALLRKRLEESAEPEESDSNSSTAAGENSLTLKVNSTAAALEDDDDETAATINILPPTPTVPSKPGPFEHYHSTNLSTEERTTCSNGSGSGKKSLSIEDALTPRRSLATDKHLSTSGKAVSESVTVPNSSSSGAGGGATGSHSNGSSTQGSPCFSPGAMHNSPDTNAKVCTVYMYIICSCTCMFRVQCVERQHVTSWV